jgi:hypothetical protein
LHCDLNIGPGFSIFWPKAHLLRFIKRGPPFICLTLAPHY